MRPKYITIAPLLFDADGVCASQTTVGAADLTIDGAGSDCVTVSGGVATMDIPRHVSLTSTGNLSAITFTITGTDRYGTAITETLSGPLANTVYSTKNFKTVTVIAVDAAVGTAVTVGGADEFESQVVPCDPYTGGISFVVTRSSGANFTHNVEYTCDNIIGTVSFDESTANWQTKNADKMGDEIDSLDIGVTGVRLRVSGHSSGESVTFGVIHEYV